MTNPKNLEHIREIITDEENEELFPQNTVYSLPVYKNNGGRIFVANFLYSNQLDADENLPRPFAWLMTPIDNQPDFMFSWCSVMDFVNTKDFPFNRGVSSYIPGMESAKVFSENYNRLITVFQQIKSFAFQEGLMPEQAKVVEEYKTLFLSLCPQGHYQFYDALAPEFFKWLDLVLIAKSDSDRLGAEKHGEIFKMLEKLSQQFEREIVAEDKKDKIFEELYEEWRTYKNEGIDKINLSMERDVILIINQLRKSLAFVEEKKDWGKSYSWAVTLLEGVEQDMIDLLYRQGVDSFTTKGSLFDANKQKVIDTTTTTNKALDKTIATRLTPGWEKNGSIIQPEHVDVYVYDQKEDKEKFEGAELHE